MGSQKSPKEAPNDLISISKLKILDLVSEGEIAGFWPKSGVSGGNPLASVYFDDVPVLEKDGTPNINISGQGFKFKYKYGASGEGILHEFSKVESLVPLPYSTRIFNPPPGKGDYRAVTVAFNTTSYPDANSARVTLKVPALYQQDSKGNTKKYSISYSIDISVNDSTFSSVLTNTIQGKCTSPYLKSHIVNLPKPGGKTDYRWKLRVRRTSENIVNDSKTQNELFLDAVSVLSSNTFSYPSSAMVGFEFSADQISSVPNRAYDIKGIKVSVPTGYIPTSFNEDNTVNAPAEYPALWNGTFSSTKVWTNNPAWIYYDILTNKKYGLGNYFIKDWIDKWTLYQIAQYCDELIGDGSGQVPNYGNPYLGLEPRFTCNVSIQDRQDAFELITSLASVFRGIAYWASGRIFPIQDRDKSVIFNYTNANVENGLFSYSDSARNTRSTIANVKWNDPNNLFREKIEIVEDPDGILKYGYIEKNLNAFACTSQGQAHRVGAWLLLTERLLTETVSFRVGVEGLNVRPGDVFNIYDNYRTNKQQGGRISGLNNSTTIVLDREVQIQTGVTYSLSVVCPQATLDGTGDITSSSQIDLIRNSQIDTRSVLNSPGNTYEISIPSGFRTTLNGLTGNIWLLNGYSQNSGAFYETKSYKCLNISEAENTKFDILGLQYDSGLYSLIESNYTIINNATNTGDGSIAVPPTGLNIYQITGIQDGESVYSLLASWGIQTGVDVAYFRLSGFYSGQDPKLLGTTSATEFSFYPETMYDVGVSVATVNNGGSISSFISGNIYISPTLSPFSGAAQSSGIYVENSNTNSNTITDSNTTIGWGYNSDDPSVAFIEETYIQFYQTGESGIMVYRDKVLDPEITSYNIPVSVVQNFTGGAIRTFDARIQTIDSFTSTGLSAPTTFYNPPPRPPLNSGFNATLNSLIYNIQPNYLDTDISGVAIWYSQSTGLVPTFNNVNYYSSTFGNTIFTNFETGNVNVYISLIDTLGSLECPIYGPVSVPISNTSGSIGGTALGGVTGVGVSGNFITGGINFLSDGSITLTQSGQNIIVSGAGGGIGGGIVISSTGDGIYISLGNTGGQNLTSGVFNAINWVSGIRSGVLTFNQSNPSKIYIPNGCSGYYSISAFTNLNNNDLFDSYVWKKNGTTYLTNHSSNIANAYLKDGDYLEFYINPINNTNISGDINCDISNIICSASAAPQSSLPENGNGYLYKNGSGIISWEQSLYGFSPLDIPGCVRWYSSRSGVLTSGGNPCQHNDEIFTWKNLASESGDIYPNEYRKPIYLTGIYKTNFPVLDFGSTGVLTGINNLYHEGFNKSFTIIVNRQRKFETGGAHIVRFNRLSTNNRIYVHAPSASNLFIIDAGDASTKRTIITNNHQLNISGEWQIIKCIRRDSSSQVLVNNIPIVSTLSNSWGAFANETGDFGIGSYIPADTAGTVNSYFSDFIMYNRDLKQSELNKIDEYLTNFN